MFHEWLARSSRNPLLLHLYQQINAVRGHDQWAAMKNEILSPGEIDEYNRQHRALFEAIERRDIAAAVKQINDHLEKARRGPDGRQRGLAFRFRSSSACRGAVTRSRCPAVPPTA